MEVRDRRKREGGSALLVAMLFAVLMGMIGFNILRRIGQDLIRGAVDLPYKVKVFRKRFSYLNRKFCTTFLGHLESSSIIGNIVDGSIKPRINTKLFIWCQVILFLTFATIRVNLC